MKIRRIHFKNINSLAGVWSVDLTTSSYDTDGIFAITGPTGAGKTTILDAISLALYGRTPRLDRISQSSNEVMTRHTGECYAEIEFETREGKFISRFSQNRAHKRPDGELQQPKFEISDAKTGVILAEKKTEYTAVIEKLTGMTFHQFTRSIMLAQGEFAAFLDASDDDRGQILEQITGTGIYGDISIRVHEREVQERAKLAVIQNAIQQIPVMNQDEEILLRSDNSEKKEQMEHLKTEIEVLRADISSHTKMEEYQQEIIHLQRQQEDLAKKREGVAPDLSRLSHAERARGGEAAYDKILNQRDSNASTRQKHKLCTEQIPLLTRARDLAREEEEKSNTIFMLARKRGAEQAPVIRKVREYDIRIAHARDIVKSSGDECRTIAETICRYQDGLQKNLAEKNRVQGIYERVTKFLQENQNDAGLETKLEPISILVSGITSQKKQYLNKGRELSEGQEASVSAEESMQAAKARYFEITSKAEEAQQQLEREEKLLSDILSDTDIPSWRRRLENEKDRHKSLQDLKKVADDKKTAEDSLRSTREEEKCLVVQQQEIHRLISDRELQKKTLADLIAEREMTARLIQRIAGFEDERNRLIKGSPCPLCGSCTHPYREGCIPVDETIDTRLAADKEEMNHLIGTITGLTSDLAAIGKECEIIRKKQKDLQELVPTLVSALQKGAAALLPDSDMTDPIVLTREIEQSLEAITRYTNTIKQAELQETAVRQAELSHKKILETQVTANLAQQEVTILWTQKKDDIERLGREIDTIRTEIQKTEEELDIITKPFYPAGCTADTAGEVLHILEQRRDQYRSWKRECDEQYYALELIEQDIRAATSRMQDAQDSHTEKEKRYLDEKSQCKRLVQERYDLFKDANPDEEENTLSRAIESAEKEFKAASEVGNRAENDRNNLESKIATLQSDIEKNAIILTDLETAFSLWLPKAGFLDEASFCAARMPDEEYRRIRAVQEEIENQETIVTTRISALNQLYEADKGKIYSKEPVSVLRQIFKEKESEHRSLADACTLIADQLARNEKLALEREKLSQTLIAQQKEYESWYRLDQLIGSHDGKAFRTFAQGLTFEVMIHHANRQLAEMTDRYILSRNPDPKNPLLLSVIDTYQAGIIRTTKNLSGGERFIVSLALALGLSSMASTNVQVDSLFLDEGFGSLDETALEMALSTLAGLKQNGKVIGIISHVPALKERIPTQIVVEKGTGGRSSLSGPGVTRG